MKESKKDEEKKIEYFFENVWPYINLVIMGILFLLKIFLFISLLVKGVECQQLILDIPFLGIIITLLLLEISKKRQK